MKSLVAFLLLSTVLRGALAPNPESAKPLAVDAKAPSASVVALDGHAIDLGQAIAGKPTVLIFFRGGWCPFCSRQLAALGEHELDLRSLGYQILAVTAESADKLAATADKTHVRYRLLSDVGAKASTAYGVAYRLSAETGKAYRENGIELTVAPDGDGFWLPVPTAFIINRQGVIRFVYSNPDPSIRISSADLLAAAKKVAAE
jgi:peroxiredoxin